MSITNVKLLLVPSLQLNFRIMKGLFIKRIYEKPAKDDGYRILVDRIWPRGISKDEARLDEWDKELGPSNELRKWFGHQPERFSEFAARYKKELKSNYATLERIRELSKQKKVCILYGAKDEAHNQAVVIKSVIESMK